MVTRKFAAGISGNSIHSTEDFRAFYDSDLDYTRIEGVTGQDEPELIKQLKKQFGPRYFSCASTTREDKSHVGLRISVSNAAANKYLNQN